MPRLGWLGLATAHMPTDWIAPLDILQSSIFSGRSAKGWRGRVVYVKATPLEGYGAVKIIQKSGSQLDQTAGDVWHELIKRSLLLPADEGQVLISFDEGEFLRSIKRADPRGKVGGATRSWLRDTLSVLGGARFELLVPAAGDKPGISFEGGLIGNIVRRDPGTAIRKGAAESAVIGVWLNVDLAKLFGATRWSKLDSAIRLSLLGKPLAQWLHGFYSTHAEPYQLEIATVQRLSGLALQRADKFFGKLLGALADLAAATGWQCGVTADGKVVVSKRAGGAVPKLLPAPERVAATPVFAVSDQAEPAAPSPSWSLSTTRARLEKRLVKAVQRMSPSQAERYSMLVDLIRANFNGYPGAHPEHYLMRLVEFHLEAALLAQGKGVSRLELRAELEMLEIQSWRNPVVRRRRH